MSPAARPSHTRYVVVLFAIVLAVVQYVDRVSISQAMPDIARDLSLSADQQGWVFTHRFANTQSTVYS